MKKIISFLLVLIFVFSIVPVWGATVENTDAASEEETGLMTTLKILNTDDIALYNKEFTISRAAFIRLANKIIKAEYTGADTVPFWDVNQDNEYYGDIVTAYKYDLIDGATGDSFRPYDIITYNEAIKIICVMLGYKEYAEVNGGYPFGYMSAAAQAGFGLNALGGSDGLNYKQAIRIMFTALSAPMLNQVSYGNKFSYSTETNNTLLAQKYDVDMVTGVIEANDITNLVFGGMYVKDGIIIDGVIYNCENPVLYREMLGYRVNCYYSTKTDYNDMVYVCKERNKVIEFDADEFADAKPDKITYDDIKTGDKESVDISASVSYIYNGKALDYSKQYKPELFSDVKLGEFQCIDNNRDGNCDVVSVTSYENIVVESVNKEAETVYGKYNKGEPLELDANVKWSASDIYGKSYKIGNIANKASLMVAASLDKKYIRIIYSDKIVEGKISQMDNDNKVIINGKEYGIGSEFLENGINITVDLTGIFYLNAYDRIVNFEQLGLGGEQFGLLIGVKPDFELSEDVSISIMTSDDDAHVFKLAPKVEIDGIAYKSAEKILYTLNPEKKSAVVTAVRYWLNDEGEITKLDTPTISSRESEEFSLIKRWTIADSSLAWKVGGRLGSKFYMDMTGGVLYGVENTVNSADDVTVYSANSLNDDQSFKCDLYAVGTQTLTIKVMVTNKENVEGSGSGSKVPVSTNLCVFDSYTYQLDKDGQQVGVITYYDGTAKATAYVKLEEERLIDDLLKMNCGDGFTMRKDKKNYVNAHRLGDSGYTNLYRIYDYENDVLLFDSSYSTPSWSLTSGVVYKKVNNYVRIGKAGLDYLNMTSKEKDVGLITHVVYNAYYGGGVYEVLPNGKLKVTEPSASTVNDYEAAGDNADRLISQREYGHDRRNCYFRHSGE